MALPLKRRRKDGTLYVRPPRTEQAVEEALALDPKTLLARAKQSTSSREWIAAEALVHVVRSGHREGRSRQVAPLFEVLMARVRLILLKQRAPERVAEELLGDLGLMFAEDAAGEGNLVLDFFEVGFRKALFAMLSNRLRGAARRRELSWDAADGPEDDRDERDEADRLLTDGPKATVAARNVGREPVVDAARFLDAIAELPADEREAMKLVDLFGYDIESEDAAKVTAATLCGVTGRTIRNRLARAHRKLGSFKEEP